MTAKVSARDVQSPALPNTFIPVLHAFLILLGSVDSLCHIPLLLISKRDITVNVCPNFPFGLELFQGQFAWKQESVSCFPLLCSFLISSLNPFLAHHSPALRKPTVRSQVPFSRPAPRCARRPWLLPATCVAGQSKTSSTYP